MTANVLLYNVNEIRDSVICSCRVGCLLMAFYLPCYLPTSDVGHERFIKYVMKSP